MATVSPENESTSPAIELRQRPASLPQSQLHIEGGSDDDDAPSIPGDAVDIPPPQRLPNALRGPATPQQDELALVFLLPKAWEKLLIVLRKLNTFLRTYADTATWAFLAAVIFGIGGWAGMNIGNYLSERANMIGEKGNIIEEKAHKLEIWKACHDYEVSLHACRYLMGLLTYVLDFRTSNTPTPASRFSLLGSSHWQSEELHCPVMISISLHLRGPETPRHVQFCVDSPSCGSSSGICPRTLVRKSE